MNVLDGQMTNLEEVRSKIDAIDHQIIELLGQRSQLVDMVAQIKGDENAIVAPDRERIVYETRRNWATGAGLDADFIEDLYRLVMNYFVERQRKQLRKRNE